MRQKRQDKPAFVAIWDVCRNKLEGKLPLFMATSVNRPIFAVENKNSRVMKKNFFYAMITIMTVLTTACSSDDVTEDAQPTPKENETRSVAPSKTVLVYMAGRNSLSEVVEQAIVECRMAKNWNTDKLWYRKYADFEVTAEKFHGVSMFVPQDPNTGDYAKYNEDIQQMAWYYAVEQ